MAHTEELKPALISQLDQARAKMSIHATGAAAHANPGAKLRESFAKNRVAWIAGAAVVGLLFAKIPARTKKVPVSRKTEKQLADAGKAGFALGALKLVFDLSKPMLMAWATNHLGELAKKSQQQSSRFR